MLLRLPGLSSAGACPKNKAGLGAGKEGARADTVLQRLSADDG